jgi:hypothetical protein
MSQKVLIPSVQGGPFSKVNRMIDFDIINDGSFCDMTQSYVQLICEVESSTAGVHNVGVQFTPSAGQALYNVDLIKNCSMSNDKNGRLEDIREIGFLSHTLNEYTKSTSQKYSEIYSLHNKYSPEGVKYSPFIEMRKEGTYPSRNVQAHLRIPMTQLFSIGSLKEFPLGDMGKTRVHLELDDISTTRITPVWINTLGTDVPALQDMPLAGGSTFTLTGTYSTLQACPLYVGMPIQIKQTTTVKLTTVISSIEYTQSSGVVKFTTASPLPAVSSPQTNQNLTLVCVEPQNLVFSVVQANLGLVVSPMGPKMDVLEYTTYTTEQSTVNSVAWQKVYEVEPNCQNLLVLSKHPDCLYSKQNELEIFRIRIDGSDVVDRDVEINYGDTGIKQGRVRSPLYYDLIYKTLMNADIQLKSLSENPQDVSQIPVNNQFNTPKTLLICSPTPQTQQYKQVQLNLSGNDEIKTLILYKQVVNQIKV